MADWRVDYDNETGAGDEGFAEWWTVTNDEKTFRTTDKAEAEWLHGVLRALDAAAEPGDKGEAFREWRGHPLYYDWTTTEQHAVLNFDAGWMRCLEAVRKLIQPFRSK